VSASFGHFACFPPGADIVVILQTSAVDRRPKLHKTSVARPSLRPRIKHLGGLIMLGQNLLCADLSANSVIVAL
jgi:hypothetical protein